MRNLIKAFFFVTTVPFVILEAVFADPFVFKISKEEFRVGIFWIAAFVALVEVIKHFC